MDVSPPAPHSSLTGRATVGLIPLRTGGKSRLGATIDPSRRDGLVLAMLDDVTGALRGAGVEALHLLAGSAAAIEAAAARGLPVLLDPSDPTGPTRIGGPGEAGDRPLRAAVDTALMQFPLSMACIIVAADLPRLSASEVAIILADPAEVVVAPTAGGGTAVLRLAGGARLATCYGAGSARLHVRAAERAGLSVTVLDLPGCRHDVDATTDLAALDHALDGAVPGPATTAFVAGARG
jgi:2-phospho-L-lactate guanylyltransferase